MNQLKEQKLWVQVASLPVEGTKQCKISASKGGKIM